MGSPDKGGPEMVANMEDTEKTPDESIQSLIGTMAACHEANQSHGDMIATREAVENAVRDVLNKNFTDEETQKRYSSIQSLIGTMAACHEANQSHGDMIATREAVENAVRDIFSEIEKSKK